MLKCEITLSPYLLMILKHKVLRLRESKDEQKLCRVVYIPMCYVITKHKKFKNFTYKGQHFLDEE